eukprot:CAMPEP_0183702442 /NCGR_PEP_ID=MMETSP0737-20130205/540_1 /TAXON_ID=385413 /ORGANISM="Thalassiosira miniscula, Strain CCMP1093" /LENGTH=594 /DNA_ID=CAMNT_0025929049 /DNA_START=270 /DNA_END=2054 /DNA_ORIENTATION=+
MKLIVAISAASIAADSGVSGGTLHGHRRRLSYEKVAGYSPLTQVTDHCAIDLDQKAIEEQIGIQTEESFDNARRIYNEGGHSDSYAELTLTNPLDMSLRKGEPIIGISNAGGEVYGSAYASYEMGSTVIRLKYATTDVQESYVSCQVGGLIETNLEGCLVATGDINIGGSAYSYSYDPEVNNNNGRTLAGFSLSAKQKMMDCESCPYKDFAMFYEYYGTALYADDWINSALKGSTTSLSNGNADFSNYSFIGKGEFIKKATVSMNVFMYVIYHFEGALDDCGSDIIEDSVHSWDIGVCLYVGSLGAEIGTAWNGKLIHALADKRCVNFKTCGPDGNELDGPSKVNSDVMTLFALGKFQLQNGNCSAARDVVEQITRLMYVPLIQGVLRYAYRADVLGEGEKGGAAGAVFAASVLPLIHAANPDDAMVIYNNMRVGQSLVDSGAVKVSFENVYESIGISCSDVGGLWDWANDDYFPGMEPCVNSTAGDGMYDSDDDDHNDHVQNSNGKGNDHIVSDVHYDGHDPSAWEGQIDVGTTTIPSQMPSKQSDSLERTSTSPTISDTETFQDLDSGKALPSISLARVCLVSCLSLFVYTF